MFSYTSHTSHIFVKMKLWHFTHIVTNLRYGLVWFINQSIIFLNASNAINPVKLHSFLHHNNTWLIIEISIPVNCFTDINPWWQLRYSTWVNVSVSVIAVPVLEYKLTFFLLMHKCVYWFHIWISSAEVVLLGKLICRVTFFFFSPFKVLLKSTSYEGVPYL